MRRATAEVKAGDRLEINFDPALLALVPPEPECLFREKRYSVWNKPAGVLAQGTRFADHCGLPRLDREASGLMLLAHDGRAAAKLGELFRLGAVDKEYVVIVAGVPDWTDLSVDAPLDGKPSRSRFRVRETDAATQTALLAARIDTGRKHQIRRHLAGMGASEICG